MYDVMIIGAGPSGLARAIYASRAGLKTVMFEKEAIGGQISQSATCENYPGNVDGLNGIELTEKMKQQAINFGAELKFEAIKEVDLTGEVKVLKTRRNTYEGKTVIIASGAKARPLNVEGEKEFIGRGVGYCATCDAPFYRDKEVYVSGGGDSAVDESMYLSKFAKKVTIFVRGENLTCQNIYVRGLDKYDNIEVKFNRDVKEILGDQKVNKLRVLNNNTNEYEEYENEEGLGLFVFIGRIPNTDLFEDQVELERGYIVAGEDTKTNIPGVFAAGDVRTKELRQVVTATSDGAIAGEACRKYIEGLDD